MGSHNAPRGKSFPIYIWIIQSHTSHFTWRPCLIPPLTVLWTSYQIRKNCWLRMRRDCREGFPRNRLQGKPLVSDPGMHQSHVRHARAVMHVGIANPRRQGKRSQSRHMGNLQFYVSGKWPISTRLGLWSGILTFCVMRKCRKHGGVSYCVLRCELPTPVDFPYLSCCKMDPRQTHESDSHRKQPRER